MINTGKSRVLSFSIALFCCASVSHGGLLAHWSLDGNTDDSCGIYSGTFAGAEAYATGHLGQAGSFDGTNYVELGGAVMPLGAYTKSAWIYRAADVANNIFSGSSGHAFWCPSGAGNGSKLAAGHDGAWFTVQSDVAVPLNTWLHVAVTYDPDAAGGTLQLYTNGVAVAGTNGTATGVAVHSDASAHIGAFNNGSSFQGRIDDVGLWDAALSDAEILAIYNAGQAGDELTTIWPPPPPVTLTALPKSLQIYPRDLPGDTATIAVSGSIDTNGYDEAVLKVYRDDVLYLAETQALVYAGATAPFSFSPVISAELFNYDFELSAVSGTNAVVVRTVNDVAVGDVYIIQGQSNADANIYSGTANGNQHPFLRTFGMNSDNTNTTTANQSWLQATGDGSRNKVGGVGQWGLRMGRLLIESQQIPIAILNGAHGGQPIGFFPRNDADHDDLSTNYGRLLYRAQLAGVSDAVRAVLWYQGESDLGDGVTHEAGFVALYQDWKENYPNVERFYVHQLRVGCGVTKAEVDLRNRQRLLPDTYADISVMSTTGINGHDGCHYAYETGYKVIADHITPLVERDLYGEPDQPNMEAPNIDTVRFADSSRGQIVIHTRNATDELVFDSGTEADWIIQGSTATVTGGSAVSNRLTLTLSEAADGATNVIYTGHSGSGPWVTNVLGLGLLTFSSGGFSPPASPPAAAPTNITGLALSSARVQLSWNAVVNADSFAVRRDGVLVGITNAHSFTDGGLTASTSYDYTVASVNALGTSTWSSVVSVTTPAPLPVPSAPTGLTPVTKTTTSVQLAWPAVSNALWYIVQRDGSVVHTLGGTNWLDEGLSAQTSYDYALAAANDSGTSAWSTVISVTTMPYAVFSNVEEASDYEVVYALDIPDTGNFRDATPVPYGLDRAAAVTGYFDRVAYYLELDDEWVYVSMDAFTAAPEEIGLPHTPDNPVFFQMYVSNMLVLAGGGANVTTGAVSTGNIEFWPHNFAATNAAGIPGANSGTLDFGDEITIAANPGYGSFQVHNHAAAETIFAYNRWGTTGNSDLGIGNQPTGQPDWTFAQNAATYTVKGLYMLVRPAPPPPPPSTPADLSATNVSVYSAELDWTPSGSATGYVVHVNSESVGVFEAPPVKLTDLAPQTEQRVEVAAIGFGGSSSFSSPIAFTTLVATVYTDVPEALDFEVIYELDIEDAVNYRATTLPGYDLDSSASLTQSFDRVAYCLQLDNEWVFVSMDAFTSDPDRLAIPQNTLNYYFQQSVSNLSVTASAGSTVTPTNGSVAGWIEFWPNNYSEGNGAGVPGASDTVYDFGDTRSGAVGSAGYGSFQVHNVDAGEVLLAYNGWGASNEDCIGIGNNTVEQSPGVIHTDWTFRNNAPSYAVKRLYVLARLPADADGDGMDDAWERSQFGGTHTLSSDDSDGDGSDNGTEYVAGTDASDRNDLPLIRIESADGTLQFASVSQRTYQVLYNTNLLEEGWQALGTNMPGDGSTIIVTDTNSVDAQRFYKLGISR